MKICGQVLTWSTQEQNRLFHVVERARTGVKCTKMKNARAKPANCCFSLLNVEICDFLVMVGEMVQNSQRLNSFAFSAIIIIHQYIYSHSSTKFLFKEYIYSHLATKFLFKKYIYSHLTTYFLLTNIFTHIYGMYLFTFNGLYSFTFTIEMLVQHGAIFIQHFLRTPFAHHEVAAPANF